MRPAHVAGVIGQPGRGLRDPGSVASSIAVVVVRSSIMDVSLK